jgi:hypothetical protein
LIYGTNLLALKVGRFSQAVSGPTVHASNVWMARSVRRAGNDGDHAGFLVNVIDGNDYNRPCLVTADLPTEAWVQVDHVDFTPQNSVFHRRRPQV